MKLSIIVLACALPGAACADLYATRAQAPTSPKRTMSAPAESLVTAAPKPTDFHDSNADSPAGVTQTTGSTSTPRGSSATAGSPPIDPNASASQTGQAPTIVSNPGVADQTKHADNTGINDRDRHGALTPMDQGGSGAETKITAAIRRGIMGDSSLSFTAKNVKVITVGTKVTLRGTVMSEQEKTAIAAHATQAAGVSEVDNQLELKK